jgi:NADH dehydrogenase
MILVTGASGYVGSHLVARLAAEGKKVRILASNPDRMQREGRLRDFPVEVAVGDVTKPETLSAAMDGIDTVIHLVAIAIEKGRGTYEEVNYQGTVNVVEAARAAGVKRFLNMCQMGADPEIPYRFLASKGKAQAYVAASGLAWTAFRPSVIWGPEDEFANTFARLIPLTPIIFPIIGDGKAAFQPVWIEDVVTAFVRALEDDSTVGHEYELGGPEVLTMEQIERRTFEAIGAKRIFINFPISLLRIIVSLMEFALPAPPVTRSLLELLSVNNVPIENSVGKFLESPRAFTAENAAPYMRNFKVGETIAQFFGR